MVTRDFHISTTVFADFETNILLFTCLATTKYPSNNIKC